MKGKHGKRLEEEHERMLKHNVWPPVKKDEVPKHAKVLSTTWAMKKKASGVHGARINARGFQQKEQNSEQHI